MRVLFATCSETTLFLAMAPLAWALRTAGHEVRVATQPALVDTVVRAGLTAVPVGRDHVMWGLMALAPGETETARGGPAPPYDTAELPDDEIVWTRLRDGYTEAVGVSRMLNDRMVADLVAFCRGFEPDLVVWEPDAYAAPIAAQVVGATHVRLLWSQDVFGLTRTRFVRLAPAGGGDDPLGRWLGGQVSRHSGGQRGFAEELTVGAATLDQLPPTLRVDGGPAVTPMRFVPYHGAAVVPVWLREPPQAPRVCLTLGRTATERFGGYALDVGEVLEALAALDVEVVAALPGVNRSRLPRLPESVRVVDFVPLEVVLPTCAVVVHHAGFGTLCSAALHAVPHVVLPDHFDEPPLARCLVAAGAAVELDPRTTTGAAVAAAVARVLTEPGFGEAARRLRTEVLAMPVPNDVVDELAELVAARAGG